MTSTINRRPDVAPARANAPAPPARIPYLPELDGLRALAVAAVVADHAGLPVAGSYGVTVFFVLSGYLISSLLLAEHAATGRIGLRGFYRRRAARLAPALLTVLTATVLWLVGTGNPVRNWWCGLVGALTYTTNVLDAVAPAHVGTYFEYCWSLAVEEQFYLIGPVLLVLVLNHGRRPRRLLATGCVITIAAAWLLRAEMAARHASGKQLSFSFASHVDALAWGVLIALLARHWRTAAHGDGSARRTPSIVLAVALAVLAVSTRYRWPLHTFAGLDPHNLGMTAMLAAAVVWACVTCRGGRLTALLRSVPLVHLGRLSYGLYLWNMLCMHVFLQVTGHRPADAGWASLLWLAALLTIAETSYHFIETPLRRRWTTHTAPRGPRPTAPPAGSPVHPSGT